MDYKLLIENAAKSSRPLLDVSKDVFILGPTKSFSGWEEESFKLISEIAAFFSVSVRCVHFCGSAKVGFSPTKMSEFVFGKSDLDVAILDSSCFRKYHELVLMETNQLRFRQKFPLKFNNNSIEGRSSYDSFVSYISKGIFRPDFMPAMLEKSQWLDFFYKLSARHKLRYKSISAAIYLSDVAFNLKQAAVLQKFIESKGFI